jgi:hypothetical protein
MHTIPFHALFAEDGVNPNLELADDARELLRAADAVVAVDVMTGHKILFYGRTVLDLIATGGLRVPANAVCIELDMDTDEVGRLLALLLVVKGPEAFQLARPYDNPRCLNKPSA